MPLTSSQLRDVEQWIRSRGLVFQCACCGGRDWTIQKELAFTLTVEPDGGCINYLGGYPMVATTCNNCGYTAFFNAIQLGLMARS